MYHYGFILSCGQTRYRSFDHELTGKELLQWHYFFEDTVCNGENTPDEGNGTLNP